MMEKRTSRNDTVRKLAISAGVITVMLVAGVEIFHVLNSGTTEKKRVMEVVQLKLIPPPPPPKVEPPPEPPKMVEQKIQPPVDKPDDKPKDKEPDKPPPGPLALDAKGGPGSDAFGLGGKPGGSDYIGGDGGGGNGSGRWTGYSRVITDEIQKRLSEILEEADRDVLIKNRETMFIWVSPVGKIARVTILHSTGHEDTDGHVQEAIASMPPLSQGPDPEMPQPIIVRVRLPSSSAS